MSVNDLGNGKYDVYIRISRTERFRKRITASSRLEAILYEKKVRKQLGREKAQTFTLSTIYEDYIKWVETHQAPATCEFKKKVFGAYILPFFGNFHPDRITSELILDYQRKRLKETRKEGKRMVNLELLALSALVGWAVENGQANDPLPKYTQLSYKRPIPDTLSKDEIMAILAKMETRHRALFLCLYHAGMRKSEACGLKWKHIRVDQGFIVVLGKGGKYRLVPLSTSLKDVFTELGYETADKEALIFPSKKTGGVIGDIRKPLQTAMKKAKIARRVTPPHAQALFRNSFA